MTKIEALVDEIHELSKAPVECDGFASLVATLLNRKGQDFKAFSGVVRSRSGKSFSPHIWIEWNGKIIDFKAKMWLDELAPHGIMDKDLVQDLYDGSQFTIRTLSPTMEAILKLPFDIPSK
ncbi:hypothetical protein [Vibrio owensii]|uniref:hypothetical protein n=1 Tax=Vibrio harveyi group TaxID=717610 RepID=UPI003CC6A1B9